MNARERSRVLRAIDAVRDNHVGYALELLGQVTETATTRADDRGDEIEAGARWIIEVDRAVRGYHRRQEHGGWPDYGAMLPEDVRRAA